MNGETMMAQSEQERDENLNAHDICIEVYMKKMYQPTLNKEDSAQ